MTRLLVLGCLLVLVGAACGAAENEPSVASAAAKTEQAGTSRFALSGSERDGNQQVEITCTGEADYAAERVLLGCEYGPTARMEIVGIGRTTYLRGNVLGISGADKWVESTGDDSLGADLSPKKLLAMLRAASESTERIGEAEIRGVDTVGHRLVVDCDEAKIADCDGETTPVDVWVSEDGLVRRIALEQAASPFTFDFYDFGVAVDIEAPPPSEVETLQGAFGAQPCPTGFGKPIEAEQALAALRRHGFTIAADALACSTESASFGNAESRAEREGRLYCVVRETAPVDAPRRVEPLGSGVHANALRLQNLECTVVARAGGAEKVARLTAALRELER